MFKLDRFTKKSGNIFNLQEANFNLVTWEKEDNEELVHYIQSTSYCMKDQDRKDFLTVESH